MTHLYFSTRDLVRIPVLPDDRVGAWTIMESLAQIHWSLKEDFNFKILSIFVALHANQDGWLMLNLKVAGSSFIPIVPKTHNLFLQVKNSSPTCFRDGHFPALSFLGNQTVFLYNLHYYNQKYFSLFPKKYVLTTALIWTLFNGN